MLVRLTGLGYEAGLVRATVGDRSVSGNTEQVQEVASLVAQVPVAPGATPIELGEALLACLRRGDGRGRSELFAEPLPLNQLNEPVFSAGVFGKVVKSRDVADAVLRKTKQVRDADYDCATWIPVVRNGQP